MTKFKIFLYLFALFFFMASPMQASADIGPKPSVVIEFVGLEDEQYYVTLLSEKDSTGPWSLGNDYYEYMGDEAVFQKFCEYEDEFYFLSYMQECSDGDVFEWTYYPPSPFKILIYFPEHDRFLMAETICERYAFDSYFTVEVTDGENPVVYDASKEAAAMEEDAEETVAGTEMSDMQEENSAGTNSSDALEEMVTETKASYDFSMEIVSLIARIVLTIAAELAIALLFGYRNKKALTVIALANVFTQVVLNVLLNVINYRSGHYAFVFHYVWMEIAVFLIEAALYRKLIGQNDPATGKKYHSNWYAAVANLISFVVGICIARAIPGIF